MAYGFGKILATIGKYSSKLLSNIAIGQLSREIISTAKKIGGIVHSVFSNVVYKIVNGVLPIGQATDTSVFRNLKIGELKNY